MENILSLSLEAHNAEKNHHRCYEMKIGRDLFGYWTVCVRYGGKGGLAGRELRYGGLDPEPLLVIIRDRLLGRLSAIFTGEGFHPVAHLCYFSLHCGTLLLEIIGGMSQGRHFRHGLVGVGLEKFKHREVGEGCHNSSGSAIAVAKTLKRSIIV
jgi:hypothetical protein